MKTHGDVTHGGIFRFNPPEFRPFVVKDMDGTVREDRELVCSHCGSLTVDSFLDHLQESGVEYSGTDWKYGWPHKFYLEVPCTPYRFCSSVSTNKDGQKEYGYDMRTIEHRKFYAEHLLDATPEQFARWDQVAAPLLGVRYRLTEEKDNLIWELFQGQVSAGGILLFPQYGFQAHGVVVKQ